MRQALRGSAFRAVPQLGSRFLGRAARDALEGASIPAPVKGWDAANPLAEMDPASAVFLDNWFPEPTYCRLRAGHTSWATGLGSTQVESLMTYHGASGTNKMFGACGTNVYDVTSAGAVGAAAIGSTGNARFQHVNFTTSGGHFLFVCNGSVAAQYYDGATWTVPSITNLTSTDIIHVASHQHRLWFTLINSTKAWYLPIDSIAGAAAGYEFGTFFTEGGYLNAIGTWSIDSGAGMDDHLAAISSRGQVAIFAGTDPSSTSTWALKGVYKIGAPIGRRCFTKVGGDLAVITVDGVVSLSQAIALDRAVSRKAAITSNIQNAMNQAAKSYKDNFGWQLIQYPLGTAVYLNVPITQSTLYYQYVMNPLTGAWCRYKGMNAACWEINNDDIFFGGRAGVVYQADDGNTDNGTQIVYDLKTAFNYFKTRGRNKAFRMVRANMFGDGRCLPTITINGDFRESPEPTTVVGVLQNAGVNWNDFDWNDGTLWGGGQVTFGDWIGVEDQGHCAAIRMKVAPLSQSSSLALDLRLNSFDVLHQPGSFL